jgi:hypothetical protein
VTMTKRLAFTESTIKRAVAAARKAGLDVNAVSISPNGTITVHHMPEAVARPGVETHNGSSSDWEDLKV